MPLLFQKPPEHYILVRPANIKTNEEEKEVDEDDGNEEGDRDDEEQGEEAKLKAMMRRKYRLIRKALEEDAEREDDSEEEEEGERKGKEDKDESDSTEESESEGAAKHNETDGTCNELTEENLEDSKKEEQIVLDPQLGLKYQLSEAFVFIKEVRESSFCLIMCIYFQFSMFIGGSYNCCLCFRRFFLFTSFSLTINTDYLRCDFLRYRYMGRAEARPCTQFSFCH